MRRKRSTQPTHPLGCAGRPRGEHHIRQAIRVRGRAIRRHLLLIREIRDQNHRRAKRLRAVADQHAGASLGHQIRQPTVRQIMVQWQKGCTQLQHRQKRGHMTRPPRHFDPDNIPRSDTSCLQTSGKGIGG